MRRSSFRPLWRSGAALVLTSVLLAGCGKGGGGRIVSPTYGDPADLVAWVNVTLVEFHPGEIIQIEVGVRNPTPHPIMAAICAPCISYVVKDSSGAPVAPDSVCTCMAIPREIAPGETIAEQRSWDGTTAGRPLPSGEYEVGSAGLPVSAPPVTIRLLAP